MSTLWMLLEPGVLTVVSAAVVVVACLFGYIAWHLRKVGRPTSGMSIDSAARPNTALIVIDVQEDFTRNTGRHGYDPELRNAALSAINREIASARAKGQAVVFIKNVFRDWPVVLTMKLVAGGLGTAGRAGLKIDGSMDVGEAAVFEKSVGDAFSAPAFVAYLEERKIGYLTLVGLDACHCVQLTAKGALARGYGVTVKEPSILTTTPDRWRAIRADLELQGTRFA